jgi:hypothetical protein
MMLDNQMDGGLASFGLSVADADEIRKVALGRIVPFQQLDVLLNSAPNLNTVYPIAGNFLTFDFNQIGTFHASWMYADQRLSCVLMGPDGAPSARLPVYHGSVIRAPFFGIAFEGNWSSGGNNAVLRLVYGTNVDFVQTPRQLQVIPGNAAMRTLVHGTSHRGVSEFRGSTLAANTVENIVPAATNTNGIFVQFATLYGPGQPYSLSYGASAPSAAVDNNPLLLLDSAVATVATTPHPRTIQAGNRLDRIATLAQTSSHLCHVAYMLTSQQWQFP